MKKIFLLVLGVGVSAAALPFLLLPMLSTHGSNEEFFLGKVENIISSDADSFAGQRRITQKLSILRLTGDEKNTTFVKDYGVVEGGSNKLLTEGETVILEEIEKIDGSIDYLIRDTYRLPSLLILTIFFIGLTIMLGGLQGVRAFIGLFISVLLLTMVVIPMIMRGVDPFLASLLGSFVIATVSLYIAHGFTKRTSVSLIATLMTLGVSAILAYVFVSFSHLLGMGSEEAIFLQSGSLEGLNLRGLLLGGIIIGALGVLDDITTAQVATVGEIRRANPALSDHALYASGTVVGKEHIASLINTLALAYVGSSFPLLLLFSLDSSFPAWVTLNSEFIAEEIVRTLVGSSALLLAVPISTWLAVVLLRNDKSIGGHSHSHYH